MIYTIPPSSPVYNVTYVTQVRCQTGLCNESYTAGYMGAFIVGAAVGAVVAGGTGYYYPPYYYHPAYGYPVYHPYPTTYGYSSTYHTTTGAYGVSQTAYWRLRRIGNSKRVVQSLHRDFDSHSVSF